jgi:hypothetical protein
MIGDDHGLGERRDIDRSRRRKSYLRSKRTLVNKRRVLKRFLAAHPQRTLTPADFAIYKSLRAEYRLAIRRYNRKVRDFNRLADRFNAVLLGCKIG